MRKRTTPPPPTDAASGPEPSPARPPSPTPLLPSDPHPDATADRVIVASLEPFALWRERRRRAARGEGVVPTVTSDDGRRVRDADAAAKRAGIRPGSALAGARQRLPDLHVVTPDGPDLAAAWDAVLDEARDVSPFLAAVAPGVLALRASPADAHAFAVRHEARVGVADTVQEARLLALLAPPGTVRAVPPDEDPWTTLDRAPVAALRALGLPDADRDRLAWLGVTRVGDLRAWSARQRAAFLGPAAAALAATLDGPRDAHVPLRPPPLRIAVRHAFDDPAREPAELDPVLADLADRIAAALGERSADRLRVRAEAAGVAADATRRAKRPLRDADAILRLAHLALADAGLVPLGLDALTLEASGLARRSRPGALWRHRERRERATALLDARFPGHARRFAVHDPGALRASLRWRLLNAASGEPLPWPGDAPAPAPTPAPAPAPAEAAPAEAETPPPKARVEASR
ncbi:MAG: hypothetical protein RI554_09910 [Trueperaceae bacterium]|nr:hypothetical protein [Trueperaceae bacterium]